MKRIIIFLLVLGLCLTGCQRRLDETSGNLDANDMESMTIKVLPSPPKMKTIDEEEDIEDIIEYINSISKEKTDLKDIKGWQILIQTYGEQQHSISFSGTYMCIDDVWYKIGEGEIDKIEDLYHGLDYNEENVENKTVQYGGTDVEGNSAADVVRKYYECLQEDADKTRQYFTESCNNQNVTRQDIELVELSHCEVVEETKIRESDTEWIEKIASDYYAYCFVQTSDVIVCKEDGALGFQGEEVSRDYSYTLVMETKDSQWKIYDFGYPPQYIFDE